MGELKLLAIAGAVLSLYFGAKWKLHEARQEGKAACQAEYAAAASKAQAENAATLVRKIDHVADIDRRNSEVAARLRAAADSERATADRLRDQLAAIGSQAASEPAPTSGPNAERVAVLAGLLREGVGLVQEGAERVGRLANQVEGLQAFASSVCLMPDEKRP